MYLASYLKSQNVTASAFARTVGVSKQLLHKYLTGACFPRPIALKRICEATSGAVTADDFVQQHTAPGSPPPHPQHSDAVV